ncbi:MAG: hypothetical protein RRY23_08790, partial [Alistipes sp.]
QSILTCVNPPYKQGEDIAVQFQLLDEAGAVMKNLLGSSISILLRSDHSVELLFCNPPKQCAMPIEVDAEGFIAFKIDGAITQRLRAGMYYMEIKIEKNSSKIISDTIKIFEIIGSEICEISDSVH